MLVDGAFNNVFSRQIWVKASISRELAMCKYGRRIAVPMAVIVIGVIANVSLDCLWPTLTNWPDYRATMYLYFLSAAAQALVAAGAMVGVVGIFHIESKSHHESEVLRYFHEDVPESLRENLEVFYGDLAKRMFDLLGVDYETPNASYSDDIKNLLKNVHEEITNQQLTRNLDALFDEIRSHKSHSTAHRGVCNTPLRESASGARETGMGR